jgi:hypothetical protein
MMKKALSLFAILSLICFFSLGTAFAGEAPSAKAPNTDMSGTGKVTAEAVGVDNYALAHELAEYGKQHKDPYSLLAAARIIKATAVKEEKRTKTTEGTPAGTENSGKVASADDLLAAAKGMAEGKDMALVAMIDKEMQVSADRGAVNGPNLHRDRVGGNRNDIYKVSFKGSELARVAVIGDGDADLDLFVYDQGGHLIGKDTDRTSRCLVEWVPRWTGPFQIKVRNVQSGSSAYLLVTN